MMLRIQAWADGRVMGLPSEIGRWAVSYDWWGWRGVSGASAGLFICPFRSHAFVVTQRSHFPTKSHLPGLPWWLSGKESTYQCRRCRFDLWVGKIPWKMKCQPALLFLPGKSHRQRSLLGCSPWGCKELDTTKWLTHFFVYGCNIFSIFIEV